MMARILCCMLALRLTGAIYSPPDIDFDTVEIWPLSGGVRDGVNVMISASSIKSDDTAIIDFLTASYEVAFRFEVDTANKLVKRNSAPGDVWGTEQTRGGWPFADDLNTATTLNFLKGRNGWSITIDGARTPWLDFAHVHSDAVVYAAVYTGFEDGEVVDTRPECSVACHPEECSGGCSDPNGCFSRLPSDGDDKVATCTNQTTTGEDFVQCCQGRQLNTISLTPDAGMVGQWVRVFEDSAAVTAACEALVDSASNCAAAAGHKVEITAVDSTWYTVRVPQLWDQSSDSTGMPADVMQTTTRVDRLIDTPASSSPIKTGVSRSPIGLVTAVTEASEAAGIMQWDFINMFRVECSLIPAQWGDECTDRWWLSYSDPLWAPFRDLISQLWLNDEETDHTTCADDSKWADSMDHNCGNYTTNVWCADHAMVTPEFTNATGATTLNELAVSSFHAGHMCCLCGGGYHEAPPAARSIYQ